MLFILPGSQNMLPQLKFWAETLVPPKVGWEIGWDAMTLPINVLRKYF